MEDRDHRKFSYTLFLLIGVIFLSGVGYVSGGSFLRYKAGPGLELDLFNTFSMITTCDTQEVLKWDETATNWECSSALPTSIHTYNKTIFLDNAENWGDGNCGGGDFNGWDFCDTSGTIIVSPYGVSGLNSIIASNFDTETEALGVTLDTCDCADTTIITLYWAGTGLDSGDYGELRLQDIYGVWHTILAINETNTLPVGNPSPEDFTYTEIDLSVYPINGTVNISWFFKTNLANEKIYYDVLHIKHTHTEDSLDLGTSLIMKGDIIPDTPKTRNLGSYDSPFDFVFADDYITLSDYPENVATDLIGLIQPTNREVIGVYPNGTEGIFYERVVDYSTLPDWVRSEYLTDEEGRVLLNELGLPQKYLMPEGVNTNRLLMLLVKESQDRINCPVGFTPYKLGCIQIREDGFDGYREATLNCLVKYGGRLPTYTELLTAFVRLDLIGETNNGERISDISGAGCGFINAQISLNLFSFAPCPEKRPYRCFIPK